MKKFFVMLMAFMLLLSSTTYATDKFGTLNKVDSNMLFGKSDVNALKLGQNEMTQTEGEWFWAVIAAIAVGWASRTPAHAPDNPGGSLPDRYNNGSNFHRNSHLVKSPSQGTRSLFSRTRARVR